MAAWFSVVKALLPHLDTIVSVAAPVFGRRRTGGPGGATNPQDQILELQDATARNTALIKDLAEQVRAGLAALEQGTLDTARRLRRAYFVAGAALVIAALALILAAIVISRTA